MIVFRDPAEIPEGFGPSVIAIGKFDGVHTGHRALIDRARTRAAATEAKAVAVTFDRNPLAVLRPDACPPPLIGVHQKVRLLAETGIDATLVLRFDTQLAALEAAAFVEHILVGGLGVQTVLVGEDFRFGRGGVGDTALLAELGSRHGFDVHVIEDVRDGSGRRVSSTWIRELLADGDVEEATSLLGRPPSMRAAVVRGMQRGRELGYPTANLGPAAEGFVPADGVYAGWLLDGGPDAQNPGNRYPAAISVGHNPTFDDVTARQVEAYVLDETDLELYGHDVELQFIRRIRAMAAFDGIDALIEQMADDVARVRRALT